MSLSLLFIFRPSQLIAGIEKLIVVTMTPATSAAATAAPSGIEATHSHLHVADDPLGPLQHLLDTFVSLSLVLHGLFGLAQCILGPADLLLNLPALLSEPPP